MVDFRVMKPSDLGFFMQLMDMVGWGMTPNDFNRILRFSPSGCFVASIDGEDVGIVATVNYGEVAWLGNLIVKPKQRGQGIGEKLMVHAMKELENVGVKLIRLDGVPKAVPLYRRLGYHEEYWSLRYLGEATEHKVTCAEPMKEKDLSQVARLDVRYFNLDRRHILEYVYEKFPELCFTAWKDGELVGYIMAKDGSSQVKTGPWICESESSEVAEELLYSVMNQRVGETLWVGLPEGNKTSVDILERNGFKPISNSLRMCYGDCRSRENVEGVFGLGGPDKG